MNGLMTPEAMARLFHETYEELAPSFGYTTREASRKPWEEVPEQNRLLMVAVADRVLSEMRKNWILEAILEKLEREKLEREAQLQIG